MATDLGPYIETVLEDGGGPAMGVMLRGEHVSKAMFAAFANTEYKHPIGHKRHLAPGDVEHVYIRGRNFSTIGGRGATPATYAEW